MRDFFASRGRKIMLWVGALVGAVGLAFASVAFTSVISGSLATADTVARWQVTAADTAGDMKLCDGRRTEQGANVRATAFTVNGESLRNQVCTVKLVIRNTGATSLKVTGGNVPALPAGWTVDGLEATGLPTIPANGQATVTANLKVANGASPQAGTFAVNITADAVDTR